MLGWECTASLNTTSPNNTIPPLTQIHPLKLCRTNTTQEHALKYQPSNEPPAFQRRVFIEGWHFKTSQCMRCALANTLVPTMNKQP